MKFSRTARRGCVILALACAAVVVPSAQSSSESAGLRVDEYTATVGTVTIPKEWIGFRLVEREASSAEEAGGLSVGEYVASVGPVTIPKEWIGR
jgi:hypothetical protein